MKRPGQIQQMGIIQRGEGNSKEEREEGSGNGKGEMEKTKVVGKKRKVRIWKSTTFRWDQAEQGMQMKGQLKKGKRMLLEEVMDRSYELKMLKGKVLYLQRQKGKESREQMS